jgi:hypothetical protein
VLRDDERWSRRVALLSTPLLLVAGYLAVAAHEPLVIFTRFFWPAAAAASILAASAVALLARRAPGTALDACRAARGARSRLLADRWDDHRWRERIMLAPFETHAALAAGAVEAIARSGDCSGAALVPLAYLPLAAWRAPDKLARGGSAPSRIGPTAAAARIPTVSFSFRRRRRPSAPAER